MTVIADTIDDLTAEWFTGALREGGTIAADTSVRSTTSALIGTGQLGLVARSELAYDGGAGPASLVVKLPSQDQGSRQMGAAMGVYESEVRFYEEIAPRLVAAEIPRLHWADVEPATGRFTLVLDDLSGSSDPGDMVAGCSAQQAELAIAELVKLQAPVWDDPSLRSRPWLDSSRTALMFGAVAPSLDLFIERFAERLEPEHLALVRRLAPKAGSYTAQTWHAPFVVAHSDYRVDNMMFGKTAAAPPIAIIDWQGARLGPPLLDAAIFLGACLSSEQRREIERDLLRSYHADLLAAGISGFSFEDCWESYRACSLFPFLLGIAVSVTIAQTERGDAMWARLVRGCADLVLDTGAAELLD